MTFVVSLALACTPPQPAAVTPGSLNLLPHPQLDDAGPAPVAPSGLLFNEVMAENDSTVMDPQLVFSDWIELVNTSDEAIDLSRVRIEAADAAWQGTEGVVEAGGVILLWAGGETSPDTTPFALDKDGEFLTLDIDGVAVDHLATGAMSGDTSWARFPDGGAWALTARPTPGATNGTRPSDSVDPTDLVFQTDRISDIELTIPDASWSSLESSPYTKVLASLTFEGAYFPEVHVHIKGVYGSLRNLDQKTAFKIDLDDFDQRLRGLESLTLNNMVQDPSYVHEYLAYSVFRAAGVPAPRVGYTRLVVNGIPFGLYAWIESVDDVFLSRWYADASGPLYEGAYGVDFTAANVPSFDFDEGDVDDRAPLYAVADVLSGAATDDNVAALEKLVDLDEVLRESAAELLTLHWDGYTTENNYRVYLDPSSGRFTMIPWGADQTFHDHIYGLYGGNGRLLQFCLANASCRARYEDAVLHVADIIDGLDLDTTIDHVTALLDEDIKADARRESNLARIHSYVLATRDVIAEWPDDLRDQLE